MSRVSGVIWVWILAAVLLAPQVSEACPVCFQARNEANRIAFTLTTILLTALPLAMIGSAIFWLRQRFLRMTRDLEDSEAPERASAAHTLSQVQS